MINFVLFMILGRVLVFVIIDGLLIFIVFNIGILKFLYFFSKISV